mgnify:CR=1 FL=1
MPCCYILLGFTASSSYRTRETASCWVREHLQEYNSHAWRFSKFRGATNLNSNHMLLSDSPTIGRLRSFQKRHRFDTNSPAIRHRHQSSSTIFLPRHRFIWLLLTQSEVTVIRDVDRTNLLIRIALFSLPCAFSSSQASQGPFLCKNSQNPNAPYPTAPPIFTQHSQK